MPQVTVYIRDDDLELWKSVEKKSEFIHNALNGGYIRMAYDPVAHTLRGKPIEDVLSTDPRPTKRPKVPSIPGVVTAADLLEEAAEECTGHLGLRMDCGKLNCKKGN